MKRILSILAILSLVVLLVPQSAEAANPEVRLPEYRSHVLRRHNDINKIEHTITIDETARPDTYRWCDPSS